IVAYIKAKQAEAAAPATAAVN
ncbi:MAG: hypothetical protein RLZZ446_766, partial [Bacteroidota bacterium]